MKKSYLNIIKWMLLIIIAFVIFLSVINNQEDFRFVLGVTYKYLLSIFFLYFLYLSLLGYRFYLTTKTVSKQISFFTCYKHFIIGRFLNYYIPQSGSLYRALSLKKRANVSYKNYLSSHLSFVWIDITFSFLIGTILIGVYQPCLAIRNVSVFAIFTISFVLCVLFIPFLHIIYKLLHSSNLTTKFSKFISQIKITIETLLSIVKNKRLFFVSSAIVALNMFVNVGLVYLSFRTINVDLNIPKIAIFVLLTKLGHVFVITPGGNLGIREFLFGLLTDSMGIGIAKGVSVSIILRISSFIVCCTLCFICLISDKFDRKSAVSLQNQ